MKSILFTIAIVGGLLMAYPGEAFEKMEDPSLVLIAEVLDNDGSGWWWWCWWCDSKKASRLPVIELSIINNSDVVKNFEWSEEWTHHVRIHVEGPDKKKVSVTHPCRYIWRTALLSKYQIPPRQTKIILSHNLMDIVGILNENVFTKNGVYKLNFEFWCHQRIGEDINSQLFLIELESNSIQFELK